MKILFYEYLQKTETKENTLKDEKNAINKKMSTSISNIVDNMSKNNKAKNAGGKTTVVAKEQPEKVYCCGAVKYPTMQKAYDSLRDGADVYFLEAIMKNGSTKKVPYSACAKTVADGCDYCHIHCKSKECLDYVKDVVKVGKKATKSDPYFENIGKRGIHKKKVENTYVFNEDNINIYNVMLQNNTELHAKLDLYAKKLLTDAKLNIRSSEVVSNIKVAATTVKNAVKRTARSNEDSLKVSAEEANETINEDEADVDAEVDAEDDENIEFVEEELEEIETTDGKRLAFNPVDLNVYDIINCETEDDFETSDEPIGILEETIHKYHIVEHNDKFYTVLKPYKLKTKTLYYCPLDNNIYDENKKHMGTYTKEGDKLKISIEQKKSV